MVPSRSSIDSPTRPAVPIGAASACVSSGPSNAPALPPAAIGPNNRLASSPLKTSAMKLQNTDTTNMLNTESQTKNALAVATEPGSSRKATANSSRFSAKKPYTTGSRRRFCTRATSQPNSGVIASMAMKVAVNSHGKRPRPALAPMASRTGRSR